MKPLAIVIPWFGKDLKGGAEQQTWQVATRLAYKGHKIEVLTTCCRSFMDNWAVNHLQAGVTQEHGIKIRRFRVDRADHEAFNRVNHRMLNLPSSALKPGVNPVTPEESAIFCSENINSTALLNYIKKHQNHYQAFLFIPYLYGIILNGLPLVSKQAFLQPCLHNEVYAYLPQVANLFHSAKGLLFNSQGEAQLAIHLYGPGIIPKITVVGEGVEIAQSPPEQIDKLEKILEKKDRFILYLGRRDLTKNIDLLVKAYADFKQNHEKSSLRLVLAGPGSRSFNNSVPGLVDLGLVEERDKKALLAHCIALLQPSLNESYSRVIMEAWFYGKPVAAHRDCLATKVTVECAQGGWLAGSQREWVDLMVKLDQMAEEQLAKYGKNGQAYAKENAVWHKVMERYEAVLERTQGTVAVPAQPRRQKLQEIHQLLPGFSYGDAISNQVLVIRNYLRRCGYKSDIIVKHLDRKMAHEAKKFPQSISPQAGLIYHHSIGCEVTEYAIAHPGVKCMIYHNITPAEFFRPYRLEVADLLEKGRNDLKQLAQHFPMSLGVSAYNADELAASGFKSPGVLPIAIDPSQWDMPADAALMSQLQDGKTNLLFVGRIVPNKRHEDLLQAFAHYLTMDREARLILVGEHAPHEPYYRHILNTIDKFYLGKYTLIPGKVNETQLLAFYRTSHLFWSMSEHEGFGVPLVEAMWFDVPVLAYKSSAIPETLGEAGVMFTHKDELVKVAALAKLLVKDEELRTKVVVAQQRRRENFTQEIVQQKLDNLILKLEYDNNS